MKKLVGIISACLMLCTAAFAEGYFSAEDQEKKKKELLQKTKL